MVDILKDPIRPRKKVNGKYPWDFKAPSYDNRTSSSIPAGNDYGIGFRTPVGKEEARSLDQGPLGAKSRCFKPEVIFDGEDIKG